MDRDDSMTGDSDVRAILMQIVAEQAGLKATVNGINGRLDGVDLAAREARDAARDNVAATKAQNIPAEFEKMRGRVDQIEVTFRGELVNAISRATTEFRTKDTELDGKVAAVDTRIKALENARTRVEGATGAIGWIGKNASWVFAALATIAGWGAVLGFKNHQ